MIDEAIAFMGGIDLCFGRWDTPQHVMLDDPSQTEGEAETIWTGEHFQYSILGIHQGLIVTRQGLQ